jgi:hypothetical protein
MSKHTYRIKVETDRDGVKWHYPQKRFFYVFWMNLSPQSGLISLESAKKRIESVKKNKISEYQKKIVKSEIIGYE